MIHEVDEALRSLIREEALGGSELEVALDAPSREWAARRSGPTVDMYLYDIREDLRRRERGRIAERDADGVTTARHGPPRHMKLSYLVTAWTTRPEDEHRLLSEILTTLLAHEALPASRLTGALAAAGLPVPMTVALPPPEDRAFADVWTALGGELKPSLDVVVVAPVVSARRPAEPAASGGLVLDVVDHDPTGPDDGRFAPVPTPDGRTAMRRVRRP